MKKTPKGITAYNPDTMKRVNIVEKATGEVVATNVRFWKYKDTIGMRAIVTIVEASTPSGKSYHTEEQYDTDEFKTITVKTEGQ